MAALQHAKIADRPISNRSTAAEILAPAHSVGAIFAALYGRARNGQGKRIDVILEGGVHNLLFYEIQNAQVDSDILSLVYSLVRTQNGLFNGRSR